MRWRVGRYSHGPADRSVRATGVAQSSPLDVRRVQPDHCELVSRSGIRARTRPGRPAQRHGVEVFLAVVGPHDPGGGALEGPDMTAWALWDVTLELSPFITGTTAGRRRVSSSAGMTCGCWESSLLEFHYAERAGPALVDLALFGYVAVRLIRPQGLAAIRHT
jgi:hypothetical protein